MASRTKLLTGPGNALFSQTSASQKSISKSLYAQATVEVVDGTKLTGGLRYTWENQRLQGQTSNALVTNPLVRQRTSFEKLTWRIAVDQALTQDIHAFASYNRGIKSGGFTLGSPTLPAYAPETLDAYEIGIKSDLLDRRLRLNVSGFYYDFKDIQYQQTLPGVIAAVRNAAAATIKGLDVDFELRASSRLTITGGFVVLDSKFTKFPGATFFAPGGAATIADASGKKLPFASPFNGNIGATYAIDTTAGKFSLNGVVSYNDGFFWAPSNRARQKDYTLVNASLHWTSTDDRFTAELWANNITNTNYDILFNETSLGDHHLRADPRTYGFTLGFKI